MRRCGVGASASSRLVLHAGVHGRGLRCAGGALAPVRQMRFECVRCAWCGVGASASSRQLHAGVHGQKGLRCAGGALA
eukprot:415114-Heterocapsa_arctica.AAC.1